MNRTERLRARNIERQRPRRGGGDVALQDQALLRKDAGFKMTGGQYDEYLMQEEKAGKLRSAAEGFDKKITSAEEQWEHQMGLVKAATPENVWNNFRKSWKPVRVVNGDKIEATYHLPEEVINKMHTETFNQGDGTFVGNFKEGGVYNVDVTPRGSSDAYGKELHEAIAGAEGEIYDVFMHGEKQEGEKRYNTAMIDQIWGGMYSAEELPEELKSGYETTETTRGKSQADMIREKQKLAFQVMQKQRDIIDSKRGEHQEAVNALELHDTKKKQMADAHKSSVKHRKALFGGY